MGISVIIFSKDRACQLDLCIKSIKDNFKYIEDIIVQYTSSNTFFEDGYNVLKLRYPKILFIRENNFQSTFLNIIDTYRDKYILFFTDDDVIFKEIKTDEIQELMGIYEANNKINCISLRMEEKLNFCYSANKSMVPPKEFIRKDKYLIWDWTKEIDITDWGYCSCINGHIYNFNSFKKRIEGLNYRHVNALEGQINNHRDYDKNLMISFNKTIVFNVMNNFVKDNSNRNMNNSFGVDELNSTYLNGYVIDTKSIYGMKQPLQVHGPLDYNFIKVSSL